MHGEGGSEILFGALRTKGGVSFKAEMSESGLLPDTGSHLNIQPVCLGLSFNHFHHNTGPPATLSCLKLRDVFYGRRQWLHLRHFAQPFIFRKRIVIVNIIIIIIISISITIIIIIIIVIIIIITLHKLIVCVIYASFSVPSLFFCNIDP